MGIKLSRHVHLYTPYAIMLYIFAGFILFAFAFETPQQIFSGFMRILVSRSVLFTDYIAVGGIGATLLNSAFVGTAAVLMLMLSRIKPNGAVIMGIWLSVGFAFFGKNLFNMIPLTIGVWMYAKYKKEPFANYELASLLVATLSPAVSEIAFLGVLSRPLGILCGILTGFFIGFIFPVISKNSIRATSGYNLYNMGFAGGLISTVIISLLKSIGIEIPTEEIFSSGNNQILAAFLYMISIAMILCGLFIGDIKENLRGYFEIFKTSGTLSSDYYAVYHNSIYINIGALCAFSTTLILVLGADLNGPAIAGVLTIAGFGSFGKHLKNVIPIFIGAVISAYVNRWDPSHPINVIAILFSTGLAPIAGDFGWIWGVIAGFLHLNIATHIGFLNSGLNLYNNGYAAGFVAMFLLPVIMIFSRKHGHKLNHIHHQHHHPSHRDQQQQHAGRQDKQQPH
ncbi:MAG: DUF1576 domain-containing protein [Oscillospiraceae bacterium]|nr:DUF1576 domain-containing protein [Oscillospiraceae bacterium]